MSRATTHPLNASRGYIGERCASAEARCVDELLAHSFDVLPEVIGEVIKDVLEGVEECGVKGGVGEFDVATGKSF